DPEDPSWSNPVSSVSWDDANNFCQWIGRQIHQAVRLPTEVEWEYAARGRMGSRLAMAERAKPEQLRGPGPQRVGDKPADVSWCGVADMTGNVSEWCLDPWDEKVYERRSQGLSLGKMFEYDPKSAAAELTKKPMASGRSTRGGNFKDQVPT